MECLLIMHHVGGTSVSLTPLKLVNLSDVKNWNQQTFIIMLYCSLCCRTDPLSNSWPSNERWRKSMPMLITPKLSTQNLQELRQVRKFSQNELWIDVYYNLWLLQLYTALYPLVFSLFRFQELKEWISWSYSSLSGTAECFPAGWAHRPQCPLWVWFS